MLDKGFIQVSKSPYGANLHAVARPDGQFRWCVDYRRLNAITVRDKTPLPLISESLVLLGRSRLFTRLDLCSAFNQIPMDLASREKTAFITRTGLYKCLIMPFGLTNAPATFMRVINSAFHGLLDVTCIVYLDNIIIFSPDPSTHVADVRRVLQRLVEHKLFVKAEKCEFLVTTTKFLGHTVSPDGVSMDPTQVSSHVLPPSNLAEGTISVPRLCRRLSPIHSPIRLTLAPTQRTTSKVNDPLDSVPRLRHSRRISSTLLRFRLAHSTSPL